MEKEIVMTYAGLRALEDELEQLKAVKRKEVAESAFSLTPGAARSLFG